MCLPEQHRRCSAESKAEAVQMVIETEKPVAEVARDLEINASTLANWVNAWRRENPGSEQTAWRRWKTRSAGCGWKTSS